jgi:DNA invertase Pin-like site-specific DNA recombinase
MRGGCASLRDARRKIAIRFVRDAGRLRSVVQDRNAPQKHVWRAEIVLLTAEGVGTNAIMRRTGKSKTCVWRWQERFIEEGFDGLLRDRRVPRPSSRWASRRLSASSR